ncbi:MAG: organomercurial lyase [Ktedonobacterales bacterium]
MSSNNADHAARAEALARSLPESCCDATLSLHLVRLLASGHPVRLQTLAASVGRTPEAVAAGLRQFSNIERDATGRIVAACGLSLPLAAPTAYRFIVGGKLLFTWCALDALMYPALLGASAVATSRCPVSGATIRVRVAPTRVQQIDPAQAVVTLVFPDTDAACCDVRGVFCNAVRFFASYAAGEAARRDGLVPGDTTLLPVADVFRIGQLALRRLYPDALHAPAAQGPGPE